MRVMFYILWQNWPGHPESNSPHDRQKKAIIFKLILELNIGSYVNPLILKFFQIFGGNCCILWDCSKQTKKKSKREPPG